ncbi:MAG: C4-type zinc ribbon domain-containing protein [Bdellovibrionota bacterium]
MTDMIAALKKLHIFDRRLARIERDLKLLPKRLEAIEAGFAGRKGAIDQQQRKKDRLEAGRKQKLDFLAQEREHLSRIEKRFPLLKTEREISAAGREMEASKKLIANVEEEVAKFALEIEEVGKKFLEFQAQLEDARKGVEAEISQIQARMEECRKELADKQAERKQIASGIDKVMLGKYERVHRHQGFALAMVKDDLCHACFMHIPPQTYNLVQKGQVQLCPSCHRILVMPDDDLLEVEKELAEAAKKTEEVLAPAAAVPAEPAASA